MGNRPTFCQRIKTTLRVDRAIHLVWQTSPRLTLANIGLVMLQGIFPLLTLYLMKRIVDTTTYAFNAPDKDNAFKNVVMWVLLAGGIAILAAITRLFAEYILEAQTLQVTDAVSDILHSQSIAVDLEYYEDSSYYDTLHRAQKEAPWRPTHIVNSLVQITQNSLSLLGVVGLLFSFNPWFGLIILLAALPGGIIRVWHSQRLYQFDYSQTEKERQAWYYHNILTDSSHAKELRLYNLGNLFHERYRELREIIREGKLAIARRRVYVDLIAQILTNLTLYGTLLWIAYQAIQGTITIGDLMIYYLGFQNSLSFFQSILRSVAGLYEDNLFLNNLYKFLDIKPAIQSVKALCAVPDTIKQGIRFHNVDFAYNGHDRSALNGINMHFPPGKVIALVGENGSGKTTLIKLLCRLYDPVNGQITIDGIDLRNIDPLSWRRELSVIFQDYIHYYMSAWENIWLGDIETEPNRQTIEQAARFSGADKFIKRLPQGYDTQLGQWFMHGQELSTGEWQKIALARAFWRKSRIVVLDEPTSSLDPLSEEAIFNQFRNLLDGRSAVLISHRFTTVHMADYIYVLSQGRIIEEGTHDELIANNGYYAQLYRTVQLK